MVICVVYRIKDFKLGFLKRIMIKGNDIINLDFFLIWLKFYFKLMIFNCFCLKK